MDKTEVGKRNLFVMQRNLLLKQKSALEKKIKEHREAILKEKIIELNQERSCAK